ncbi:cytochrome C [Phyllobacterium salinisoli]|uniref:Cytochrome C n=1 Tax=Phyllobacterium salinisoli TaxID=1899321 RepID=A0A368K4X9_9HYPH|nr:cytochrome c [Phyllobacterium salinisoli]RCS23543.1 cytochrome C [Phyllobacterium salinisoli]
MRKLICVAALLIASAGLAHADAVADRQALMKGIGKSVGVIAPMIKGEKPFDAAAASGALTKLNEFAQKIDVDALFPEGSDTGETTASPKIWEDMPGFKAKADKFEADAAAAAAADPKDLDSLRAQFKTVAANCSGCHQDFRVKKN